MANVDGSDTGDSDTDNPTGTRRVIKRYSNRKLYDTQDSTYVTLLQIAELIRAGEDVQIIDNATKEDKTDVTLALIISEELKAKPRGIPLSTLKALIRQHGEKILSQLRDGPIGKFMPREEAEAASLAPPTEDDMVQGKEGQGRGIRATLEQWQNAIDERIRTVLPNFSAFRELENKIAQLSARLDKLEKRLEERGKPEE